MTMNLIERIVTVQFFGVWVNLQHIFSCKLSRSFHTKKISWMILFGISNFDSFDLYTLSLLLTKIITKNDTNVTSFLRMKGRAGVTKEKRKEN